MIEFPSGVGGLTWTEQYYENTPDTLIGFCRQIENGPKTTGAISIWRNKNDHLKLAENLGLANAASQPGTRIYRIQDSGHELLRLEGQMRYRLLHDLLKEHIPHYRYAFDYINHHGIDSFDSSEDFHAQLVVQSAKDFGVRIYDEKSYENLENLMVGLGVATKEDDGRISIEAEYRLTYNETLLRSRARQILGDSRMYTKALCQRLERSLKEQGLQDMDEKACYQSLLKFEQEGLVSFQSGYPRAPIPAKHALIRWEGSNA